MTVPLAILLAPFVLFLFFFLVFSAVDLYHLVRFGSLTPLSFVITFLYLGGAAAILAVAYAALAGVDWAAPLLAVTPK